MKILGLDTSFMNRTSVGLTLSEVESIEINLSDPISLEEKLLSIIDNCFKLMNSEMSEIDAVAVGLGPGSFTGLRIGISCAKTVAWSLNKQIIGLSTLELMVESMQRELMEDSTLVVPMIDAKMGRVFCALFRGRERLSQDLDIAPEELEQKIIKANPERLILLGDGLKRYGERFQALPMSKIIRLPDSGISGLSVCRLAMKTKPSPLSEIKPVYLRKSEAEAKWDEKNIPVG